MSVKVMSWVFEHSQSTLGDRLVLLAIADHANHDGTDAYPSVATIASKARVDRATVFRAITRLVELGELEVHGKSGCRNVYRVLIPGGSQIATGRTVRLKGSQSATPHLVFKPSVTRARAREEGRGGENYADWPYYNGELTP